MRTYNGHKNWNHWNVSLWILNDVGLYRAAKAHVREANTLDEAAERMRCELAFAGIATTPDGAPYTKTAIRKALSRDM